MNGFTGGCHYNFGCEGFVDSKCKKCPQLKGIEDESIATKNYIIKRHAYDDVELSVVCPSNWLLAESKRGQLTKRYNHTLIPYGIFENIFYPYNKEQARIKLGLELDKKIILFVADSLDNYRKGVDYILDASKILSKEYQFLLVGKGTHKAKNFNHLGEISDEKNMAQIYSAADLFVIPSLADNLPNTVLESLFCGTPVIGFDIGGIPDMVVNGLNGFLCNEIDSNSLAITIQKALDFSFDSLAIVDDAKQRFGQDKQTDSYIKLYKSILE
ncbi:MAG: glycosyltransferase [Salinivirgaceae bacterium]|jgi:glycosyltransferase involved in cell wall biosynthesis|nr:glycosyltransferase [Salinivirgaceae bacterium]